ncbi:MAG: carbonic anhydrase [Actinobacteria bacterium HGW-Actinobacteria-11]|nr:MAG: carbonic anhydrase [Actinobacteria bacterium HGW-Actinobacteria-11]
MINKNHIFLCAIAGVLVLAGCSTPTPDAAPSPSTTWSYDGDNPEHWGEIAAACGVSNTSTESPIDIATGSLAVDGGSPLSFAYAEDVFELEDTGHAVEAVPSHPDASVVTRDGVAYELEQLHFHVGSEHLIDGQEAAAEIHLVHKSSTDDLLVVGVLLQVGEKNAALADALAHIPADIEGEVKINPDALIPHDSPSAQYLGSLTTPPCTEGVEWNVFLEPLTVSEAQLSQLASAYPNNHRPVQPLHDREVSLISAP